MPIWLLATHWGARIILLLLAVLSVWSVAIIIDRMKALKVLEKEGSIAEAEKLIKAKNWSALQTWCEKNPGLKSGVVKAALEVDSKGSEQIERSVKAYLVSEKVAIEKGFTALATLASNTPFIGLVGTVLGIINAFGALAQSQNNTNSVMAGISEALIATAVGLFVAIPAGIAYNIFSRRLKLILTDCEMLRDLYISRVG